MGQIHVDDMTLEILCNDVCEFTAKSVGAVSKNVFTKMMVALEGVHVTNQDVVIWHPRSVCAKFGIVRYSKGRAKSVT